MQTTVFRQLSEPVTAFQYKHGMDWEELAETIARISDHSAVLQVIYPGKHLYLARSASAFDRSRIEDGCWIWANEYGTHVAEDKAFREQYVEQDYIDRRHQLPNAHAVAQVLQQGDPEPDRSTRWREEDGTVWRFESVSESATGAAGWTPDTAAGFGRHFQWGLNLMSFPLTEVTDRG